MLTTEMKMLEAVLVVAKDSERLLVNLRFSISSHSSDRDLGISGLVPYIKATRRTLRARLVLFAIRAVWLKICRKFRPDC